MKIEIALCLPRDAATVGITRRVLRSALAELGVIDACLDQIGVALSEACSNVVEHSDATDEYEVQVDVDHDVCEIRVVDTGRGFDAAALTGEMPPNDAPRGRGVAIMRSFMDTLTFESHPEVGTVVRLTKRLDLTAESPMRQHRRGDADD